MYNEIMQLHEELVAGTVMPDMKRLYLCDQILRAHDTEQQQVYVALLDNYDRGLLDIKFDPIDGIVKYRSRELN